jgi:hypothetical protein
VAKHRPLIERWLVEFDTSGYGNSNAGHECGASLSDEERWAVVSS